MTLSTNRSNLRDNLKIDPKKKIWSDSTLDRFINQAQRWMINDPAMNWPFGETIGYLIPELSYQEYLKSNNDNPESFFSERIRQILKFQCKDRIIDLKYLPDYSSGNSNYPSKFSLYANRVFLDAGFDSAATYTTIHNMDTYDGNGTWVGSNDVINVSTDASTYKEGSGSVSFDIDVSNSTSNKATLTNSSFTSIDLSSAILEDGGLILWVYITDSSYINSFEIKFGSDSSNYYSIRQFKVDVQGVNYSNGWNRIFIPTVNYQKNGTPDLSSVGYLQINIGYDSSASDQSSVRIDSIQYVDKYVKYFYTQSAYDLLSDTDESIVFAEYQFVYELYATYKALSIIPGKGQEAQNFFQEAKMEKNRCFEEVAYKTLPEFIMTR